MSTSRLEKIANISIIIIAIINVYPVLGFLLLGFQAEHESVGRRQDWNEIRPHLWLPNISWRWAQELAPNSFPLGSDIISQLIIGQTNDEIRSLLLRNVLRGLC